MARSTAIAARPIRGGQVDMSTPVSGFEPTGKIMRFRRAEPLPGNIDIYICHGSISRVRVRDVHFHVGVDMSTLSTPTLKIAPSGRSEELSPA